MICRIQWGKSLAVGIALLVGGSVAIVGGQAIAATPLNQATVQKLKNQVQLVVKSQAPRAARVQDRMTPGDAVKTAKAAMVELRFNDRSLARIGEQAFFRFVPNTRTFNLSNGTALFLIPPGQGTTRVSTPNATAGIRGSGLFVRYVPETDTTIVGALTDSGITISHGNKEPQVLKAGDLAVMVKDQLVGVYRFDLQRFYETSDLVKDLQLQSPQSLSTETDRAIAAVRQEALDAIAQQPPLDNSATLVQDTMFLKRPEANTQTASTVPSTTFGGSRFDQLSGQSNPGNRPSDRVFGRSENSASDRVDRPTPISNLPEIRSPTFATPVSPVNQPTGSINLGATPGNPGTAPGNPGATPGNPGTAPGNPGAAPGNPGAAPGNPGAAPGNSGNNPFGGPPGLNGNNPGNAGGPPAGGAAGPNNPAPGNSGNNPFGGPPGLNGNTAPGNSGNNPFGGPPGLNRGRL